MSGADDPADGSPAARLERELRALVPVALSVAGQQGEDVAATARRVVRVVMVCVRPMLGESGSAG